MNVRVKLAVALVGVALLAAVIGGSAAAQEGNADRGLDVDTMVEVYNDNYQNAPAVVGDRFAGNTVELRYANGSVPSKDGGTAHTLVLDENGKVTSHSASGTGDEDIRIRTSRETVERIVDSETPGKAFDEAYENGEIKVSGVGLGNAVKVELAKLAVWLGKTFGVL